MLWLTNVCWPVMCGRVRGSILQPSVAPFASWKEKLKYESNQRRPQTRRSNTGETTTAGQNRRRHSSSRCPIQPAFQSPRHYCLCRDPRRAGRWRMVFLEMVSNEEKCCDRGGHRENRFSQTGLFRKNGCFRKSIGSRCFRKQECQCRSQQR